MFKQELPERTKVNLNELIQEVIAVAKGPIDSNNIVLETNLTDDVPPLVMADPVQLQQVILNLVMNAVEAMSHSGNETRILWLRTEPGPAKTVVVRVVDSGPPRRPRSSQQNVSAVFHHKIERNGNGSWTPQNVR